MSKLKMCLGILCIFVLGMAVGVLGSRIYRSYDFRSMIRGGGDSIVDRIMERYDRELDLTETQSAEIRKIVVQSRREWEEVRFRYQPEKEEITARRLARIKEQLTADQQLRLDEMYENGARKDFRRHATRRR